MDAQQLFKKYEKSRFTPEGISNYIQDLNKELNQMLKIQGDKTAQGLAKVVKEVNQLHNETMNMFIQKQQYSPLIKDAYLICSKALHPEIKRYL